MPGSIGSVGLVMRDGHLDALPMQTAEFDVGQMLALGLDDESQSTHIRCLIADFKVREGMVTAQTLLIDTRATKILDEGAIRLGARWF